jgi:hypothetical protein
MKVNSSAPEPWATGQGTSPKVSLARKTPTKINNPWGKTDPRLSEHLQILTALSEDETANPAARVSALRTLLEASGVLGKHAPDPNARDSLVPLSNATRSDLEHELSRLRAKAVL